MTSKPRRQPYLFDPEDAEQLLAELPALASLLGNSRTAGSESTFAALRKSELQLYRVLANANAYPWLGQLLRSLDFFLARGWRSRGIRSASRTDFRSALAELHAAEHFFLRDFEIGPAVSVAATGRRPDLHVRRGELVARVEVKAPVEWLALNDFFEDVKDWLKNVDLRVDFRARVRIEQLELFSDDGKLQSLNPIVLARQMRGLDLTSRVIAQAGPALRALEAASFETPYPELNVLLRVELEAVRPSGRSPFREITLEEPLLSGYAPEAIFQSILSRTRKKAKRRQAGDAEEVESLRVLLVDLSGGEVSTELVTPAYRRLFGEAVDRRLAELVEDDYDIVALVQSRGWGKPLSVHWLVQDEQRVAPVDAKRLFGPLTPADPLLAADARLASSG